jgi:hypothetical protein
MIVKGNIVRSNDKGGEGLVLALTKDGKRAKVKVFGHDAEVWRKLDSMTVLVSGDEQCWKCQGSGLFYMGGGMLNGKFTGKTGECYGCQGKGTQNNDDRLRNHYYWHRMAIVDEAVAEAERGEFESLERTAEKMSKPLSHPKLAQRKAKRVKTVHGERSTTPGTDAAEREPRLIDCECGFMHLDNVPCI